MTLPVAKAARLLHIQEMLLATPDGLTQAEIARKLGVNRSTVSRYLPDLDEFCVYEQDDGRLAIDRDNYLSQVQLTLHEAMALHLAARLMATRTDKHNPHAASALRKLGLALEQLAPLFSRHLLASAAVMDDQARRYDPVYLDVLETLTRAWSQGRKVRVWHRLVDGQVFEYEFSPYFIEPYAVGHTSHAIGFREPPGALRTFKLERIQKAELTETAYTIPASFDARGVLANAWGVWYTEDEPVDVVLKFHPRVAQRVRETQWHWSEEVEELADGGLIWRARIAEPQEMVPWIRGWGADVEVLEPEGVRKGIVKDVRRMANVYDLEPIATYQLLWAKTSRVDGAEHTHPLICHMLDVAAVAQVMWDDALTDGLRDQFAGALGLDPAETGRLLAFWAGLHDLGKASPAFQRKYRPSIAPLEEAGLSFPTVIGRERYGHGIGSAYVLASILEDELSLPRGLAKGVARAVGGHHGEWPAPGALHDTRLRTQLGDAGWDEIRAGLVKNLERACQLPAVTGWSLPREGQNAFLTLLSGFVSVADWIGSMEEYFGYVEAPVDELEYFGEAVARAGVALSALKWLDWQPPGEAVSFEELCAVPSLRPMQSEIVRLAAALDGPALVIIEAPTGVGKTEAALYLADHWARTCRQR